MSKRRRSVWLFTGIMTLFGGLGDVGQQLFSGAATNWSHAMIAGLIIGLLARAAGAAVAKYMEEQLIEETDGEAK
jgi:hypothetical protein